MMSNKKKQRRFRKGQAKQLKEIHKKLNLILWLLAKKGGEI